MTNKDSTLEVLQKALELLDWCHTGRPVTSAALALLIGPALPDTFRTDLFEAATAYLAEALATFPQAATSIVTFNDHPETNFGHVRQLFERAIELAENDERS